MLVCSPMYMSVNSYLKNGKYLTLAQAFAIIFGLLSQVLLTKNLDLGNYGAFILIIDISLTFAIFIDFGVPTWASREWDGKGDSVKNLVKNIINIEIYNFLIILIITISIIFLTDIKNNIPVTVIVISSYIVILTEPMRLGFRMVKKPKFEAISRIMERFFTFILYFLLSEINRLDFLMASFAIFTSTCITFIITSLIFYYKINNKTGREYDFKYFQTLKQSLPFTLALAVYPLLVRVDKVILGIMETVETVGIYNVGWIVISVGFSISSILRLSINPLLANKKNKTDRLTVIRNTRYLTFGLILIGIPICIFLSFNFMDILFPSEYIGSDSLYLLSGHNLVIAMMPSWIWSMLCASNLENTKFEKNMWTFSRILIITIMINAIVDLILISKFSIFGIILGTTLAQFICYILLTKNEGYNEDETWIIRNEFISGILMSFGLITYAIIDNGLWKNSFQIYSIIIFLMGYFLMGKILFNILKKQKMINILLLET